MRSILFAASLVLLMGCLTASQREAVQAAGDTVGSVAPLLPPPFGIIAGGLAALLTGVAAVGANKVSNEKFKKKEEAPMLVKLITDHSSTILGAVTVLVPALRAAGIISMSDGELSALLATFAVPVGAKKILRK